MISLYDILDGVEDKKVIEEINKLKYLFKELDTPNTIDESSLIENGIYKIYDNYGIHYISYFKGDTIRYIIGKINDINSPEELHRAKGRSIHSTDLGKDATLVKIVAPKEIKNKRST